MRYLLVFLCVVFSFMARGFVEKRSGPSDGDTILHATIRAADKDHNDGIGRDGRLRKRVRVLLRDEIHLINVVNDVGETPLFLARKYPLTTKLLLRKGADPNVVNQHDMTAFQYILMSNIDPSLLKIFFKWSQNRPDVSIVDENGLSLLQYLLHDISRWTKHFKSQYEKDREYGGGSVVAYAISLFEANKKWGDFLTNRSRRKKEAIILINEGVDLTHRDPLGELALYQALRLSDSLVAEWIIRKGGTEYLTIQDREALVRLAAEQNHTKILRLLKQKPFPGEVSFTDKIFNSCHALWTHP